MNNRFFIHAITLYHFKDNDEVEIQYYDGNKLPKVYFRHDKKSNAVDRGITNASTGSITIPTTEKLSISDNDIVIEGIVNEHYNLRELQKKYQVFRVKSVDDNRKGNLQHYKLGVTE